MYGKIEEKKFVVCWRLWQCIEVFDNGRVRQCAAPYGSVWKYIEVYGSLWKSMTMNRNIWKNKKLYWSLRKVMAVYESLLNIQAEYGSGRHRMEVNESAWHTEYGTVWQYGNVWVTLPDPHCIDTIPKFRNRCSQKRNWAGQSQYPHSPHIHVSVIYIFPGLVCLFCCRKICAPILGIYLSLTDTCIWKLGLTPPNSFSGNT